MKKIFTCPYCGHVLYGSKNYAKHIIKSHYRRIRMNKRKMKKFKERLLIIQSKVENEIELTNFEKMMLNKAKLNNINYENF